MKIKVRSWRSLTTQDKLFILKTISSLSQYKGKSL